MFKFCIISVVLTAGFVAPKGDSWLVHEIYGDHWVMWNGEKPNSEYLYLFMPGSGQLPEVRSELVLKSTAEVGLRAIGLAYQNEGSVSDKCWTSKDSDCMEKVRMERIYGDDTSDEVECSYDESVVGLLRLLLVELDEQHPEMDWRKWLDESGNPRWENIIVSGHSQGAGNAAFIARDHKVVRVIMYAGPYDRDTTGRVDYKEKLYGEVNWISEEAITPRNRFYAFYHVKDNFPHTFILEDNYRKLLGFLPDRKLDVDAVEEIVGTHRYLFSQKELHQKQSPHTYPLLERFMPVHRYMCSHGLP
ncbi:MAG: hypothetical protein QF718_08860 [Phycisphaerales bacterium]|nr:hypothetical protein [Phycisphaerales bacterium]